MIKYIVIIIICFLLTTGCRHSSIICDTNVFGIGIQREINKDLIINNTKVESNNNIFHISENIDNSIFIKLNSNEKLIKIYPDIFPCMIFIQTRKRNIYEDVNLYKFNYDCKRIIGEKEIIIIIEET